MKYCLRGFEKLSLDCLINFNVVLTLILNINFTRELCILSISVSILILNGETILTYREHYCRGFRRIKLCLLWRLSAGAWLGFPPSRGSQHIAIGSSVQVLSSVKSVKCKPNSSLIIQKYFSKHKMLIFHFIWEDSCIYFIFNLTPAWLSFSQHFL